MKDKPAPELMKALRDVQSIPSESITEAGAYAQRCVRACEGLGDDPERAVRELVDFVRRVQAKRVLHVSDHVATVASRVLERHGLLRACDDPEQLPDAWKPGASDGGEQESEEYWRTERLNAPLEAHNRARHRHPEMYVQDGAGNEERWLDLSQEDMELALRRVRGCDLCGAGAGEPCAPNCEDRR